MFATGSVKLTVPRAASGRGGARLLGRVGLGQDAAPGFYGKEECKASGVPSLPHCLQNVWFGFQRWF